MGKILLKGSLFILLFTCVICTMNAQDSKSKDIFKEVEIGSKSYYLLKTRDNKVQKARIVSVDPNKVLILLPGGETKTLSTVDVIEVKKNAYNSIGSVGLGFGIPYGWIGVNADVRLWNMIYANAGIGTAIYVNPMYSIGIKCYLLSGEHRFRPRVSANYGTYEGLYIEDTYGDFIEKRAYSGIYLGGGFQWALNITKSIAIDMDVLYIVDDSKIEDRINELISLGYQFDNVNSRNLKFSLGMRYVF